MKKTLLGVLCTFFLFSLFAQVPQRINSANLIEQGNQLHNSGKYKEAVNIYRQVPRNDTNYIKSLYETVLTQLADTAYAEALKTCEAALALDDMEYELRLLLAYGTINDDMGNSSRAMHIYDSTLKKYPNASDIWFNKGVTYMRQKKINEATEIFKTLLVKNPYYSSAHFRLAQCAVQQGQMVPAMYSLLTYLLVSPSGIHYKNAINLLDNIAKNTEEVKAYQTKPADPAFNTAQTILLSKIALDKGYKVQADLDDPIVRQLQVVLEKVQYQAGSNNFWMQYYVPLFADLWSKKLFEPVIFYALSNVNLEPINRYNKKNEKTINSATSQIGDYLNTIRQTRELTLAKRTAAERQYHFSNGELAGKGKIDSREELVGPWTFYFSNGNVKSTGRFNDKGEKEGTWKYYYANGVLGGVDNWISGKQTGEDIIYNRNGIVTGHAYYKNGQLEGDKKSFYAIGHPFSTLQYKEGKENGTQVRYYSNGKKRVEAQVKDDAFDGVYKSFYKNGQPEVVAHYSSGKLHGSYQSFYNNGQLSFSTTYNNGLLEGAATGYHIKGKVKRTQTFIADKLDGEELEYNNSGILVQKARYSKGKVQGAAEYFDDDGKLYSIFDFDKDVIKQVRYFDKSGKEISRSLSQRGQIQVTNYNPGGFKTSAITYNDAAEKINSDTYYYTSGKTKETNQYQKGKLHGISVGYHPNGKKSFEINYANDEKNGLITYYHMDGTLKSYGWYDADVLNDDWVNFNEKGKITSRTTYLDDEIIGIKETFFPDGRLDDEEVYENGWLKAVHQYDSLGNKIHSSHFVNGNGTLRYVHFNGKTSVEGAYVKGEYHGVYKGYFFDGTTSYVKTYDHGELQGDYTDYYYGGQVASKGKYKDGEKWGTWKHYNIDGKVWKEETYANGQREGKALYYYPSGKVEREIEYAEGSLNGTYKRFAEDGQLAFILYYKDGENTGYSYWGKDGQLVPFRPLAGGNGKVVTYFSNGNISAEMEYEGSSLVGNYKIYFPNGKLYYMTDETFSLTHGKLKEFYANGNLRKEYNYFWNNEDGPYKEYHENGKVKEEGFYYNGFIHGEVKTYEAAGKPDGTKQYYFGTLLKVNP